MAGLSNPIHLAFIALIVLVVLGPKRLPDVARSLGNGVRELRDSLNAERSAAPSGLPEHAAQSPPGP